MFPALMMLAVGQASAQDGNQTMKMTGGKLEALKACYEVWGDHPFGAAEDQDVQYIAGRTRILGFGSKEYDNPETSSQPTLYMVGMNINYMSGTTYWLNDPNGYYCFYNNVTALSVQRVVAHTNAKLADGNSSVVIIGSDDDAEGHGGIIVIGRVEVSRKD